MEVGPGLESIRIADLLRKLGKARVFSEGKRFHALVVTKTFNHERSVDSFLLKMYSECGDLQSATNVFDRLNQQNVFSWNVIIGAYGKSGMLTEAADLVRWMPTHNVVSWNTLISAYVHYGCGIEAFHMFNLMQKDGVMPNEITFVSILGACACQAAAALGKVIHAIVISTGLKINVIVGNALLNMYTKCGILQFAKTVFDTNPLQNVVTWNSIVFGYVHHGKLEEAEKLFQQMPERSLVSWNSIIAAYAQHGLGKHALYNFQLMQGEGFLPDAITCISVLDACATHAALAVGKQVHALLVKNESSLDVVTGTALVNMYGKCGSLDMARLILYRMPMHNVVSWTAIIAAYAQHGLLKEAFDIFQQMPEQNEISWNVMLMAYAQNGHGKEALQLFNQMRREGMKPGPVTFLTVLDACANEAATTKGKQVHTQILDGGLEVETVLTNSLIDMYGRCGDIENASILFDRMTMRNVVSWTSIVAIYAQHGHGRKALRLLKEMRQQGIMPDSVTFVSIISACSYSDLVDEGCHNLVSVVEEHGIVPRDESYNCMIDLLGRTSQLDVAEDLIHHAPFRPAALTWMTLLTACRTHLDIDRGWRAAIQVFEVDPENDVPYVLLAHIYAVSSIEEGDFPLKNYNRQGFLKSL